MSALLSSVTEVAEAALVPRLVDDDQLDAANSLLSANWELAAIAVPAVAGLIVATIGAPFALALDAASFAVMAAICLSLPRFAPDLAAVAILLGLATFAWGPYFAFERTLMQRLVPDEVRSRVVGARMTISSLGFPLGSTIGGAAIGGLGVPAVVLAIACSYLLLGLLPLLAPALRALEPGRQIPAGPG